MRTKLFRQHRFKAVITGLMAAIMLCFVLPCEAIAADGSSSLQERNIWFTYGYTECTGDVHPASESCIVPEENTDSTYPVYFSTYMMLCDSDHVVRVEGDGVTDANVTFTSQNPAVLDIDSEGNVTLKRTGNARIKATVAADDVYDECSIYLYVRADRHTGWIDTVRPHYADRPAAWGLDLDVSEGPQQLVVMLRPGAGVTYTSEDPNVASVDKNGAVTPVSAGTTQIFFDIDDGGGKYKACRFGETIKVSNNYPQEPQERQAWFTYGCTDCLGNPVALGKEEIGYYQEPSYFGVDMMMCDSNHVVRVNGDGVTSDNVTLTSLNPAVLDIDRDGNVTIHKTGKAEIKATVAASDRYRECTMYLAVTVDRHDGWVGTEPVHYEGRSPAWGLDLDVSDEPQKLVVPLRPGASVKFSIDNPNVASVDQNGVVTSLSAGTTTICFDVDDGGGKYKQGYFLESITVTGEDTRSEQEISGDQGPFTIDWHDGLQLELHAMTGLEYSVVKGDCATVDQNGHVGFTKAGTATIGVEAVPTKEYKPAVVNISITARDYAEEEAARIAAEEAARLAAEETARLAAQEAAKAASLAAARKTAAAAFLKAELARAKALKKPKLRVRALRGKKIKLTWSKTAYADGYIVYVKYPGSKNYVKAVTRNATVKSVTHRGLSRSRVYKYKVRAYKKVNGKIYYSPFSRIRKARVI